MKFGPISIHTAAGTILAHGVKHVGGVLKKGRVLSAADIELLASQGITEIITAQLEVDDVPEDIAAFRVAIAAPGVNIKTQQAFTGRANLHSSAHGVVEIDVDRVRALNHLHESLTLATLDNYSVVTAKQMVATIKVIPFATPRHVLEKAMAIIGTTPLANVRAFTPKAAGLVITQLLHSKPQLVAKSETAMRERLSALGSSISSVIVCDHTQSAIRNAISNLHTQNCDPILVFGASAIVDRSDVIPAGLVEAGGDVVHLGMPVDPGNLMMLGTLGHVPVIGVPSCARSPKTNGFDWVLERIVAGINVTSAQIMDMGAGGLLAEISSRPSPRELKSSQTSPRVAAIILAAGKSSRMGHNKMLADFRGEPMIRATVQNVLASSVDEVVVVTGHQSDAVQSALAGLVVRFVHNPQFANGLATSLKAGIESVTADAAIICLGDMPLVTANTIDRLIAAFNPAENRTIVVPTHNGAFGNPVLWGAEHFATLSSLKGDRGARNLISRLKSDAVEIETGDSAVLRDADTPTALEQLAESQPAVFQDLPQTK
jgi:molybdenum cofactor cytidylyltransferase